MARIEQCYDAIPRVGGARVERIGPFELFLREGPGWPFYARPHIGAVGADADAVAAVRARQRQLKVPEAFEWVDDLVPELRPAAVAAGLAVHLAPLMVLDPAALPPLAAEPAPGEARVQVLDPDRPDFAALYHAGVAVSRVGFAARGTDIGPDGPAQRDAATIAVDPVHLNRVIAHTRAGLVTHAVALTPTEGVVATGALQGAGAVREVVAVATLPSARRRGLGAAVSAALARHALGSGVDLVFLAADSEDVTRVYGRIGFRRIGTACIAEPAPAAPPS